MFIVHSMGGCMVLKFLRDQSQDWKDKYVRAMVSLAGPWGGAIKALKVFTIGMIKYIPIMILGNIKYFGRITLY